MRLNLKSIPSLAYATAAIVATMIGCTLAITRAIETAAVSDTSHEIATIALSIDKVADAIRYR